MLRRPFRHRPESAQGVSRCNRDRSLGSCSRRQGNGVRVRRVRPSEPRSNWLSAQTVLLRTTLMPTSSYNREVAKASLFQMLPSNVPDLLSTRLSLVIPTWITRLLLLFGQTGGGRIGRRSLAETLDLSGRVSAALKLILPFHHDASGELSSEQESLMRGTSEPFDDGRQPAGLHRRKMFQSRDDLGWSRRHPSIRVRQALMSAVR